MLGKIVLWISAIAFTAYGAACLFSPALPASYAGLAMLNGNGYAEVGAMYGGLQTGFGIFCLLAAMRQDLYRPGLLLLVLAIGALALARLISAMATPEPVGAYTWGALTYEFFTAVLAAAALRLDLAPRIQTAD
ncbi:MAG: DUF4345 family protein [Halioglobus sp.]|nr:DUF4345 family protein [Halioglobus sp.]